MFPTQWLRRRTMPAWRGASAFLAALAGAAALGACADGLTAAVAPGAAACPAPGDEAVGGKAGAMSSRAPEDLPASRLAAAVFAVG